MAGKSDLSEPGDVRETIYNAAEQFWNRIEAHVFDTFSVQDLIDLESVSTERLQAWPDLLSSDERHPLTTRDLFTCALVLCEMAEQIPDLNARLEKLFVLLRAVQLTRSRRFPHKPGNFYWFIQGRARAILYARGFSQKSPLIEEQGADFCMQGAALLWLRHRHHLSWEVQALLKGIIDRSLEYCIRYSEMVPPRYTNISLMNAMNLMLLGQEMGNKKALEVGARRFNSFCIFTWEWGIHEFTSPVYTPIHLNCLGLIVRFAPDLRIREQAGGLLELFWTEVALSWLQYYERLGSALSRMVYNLLYNLGSLPLNLWTAGWISGSNLLVRYTEDPTSAGYHTEDPTSALQAIYPYLANWVPPRWIYELTSEDGLRPSQCTVRQSWGWDPSQSCTYFYDSTISLGTSSAPYNYPAWEDMPMVANLAHQPTQPLDSSPYRSDDPAQRWFCAGRFFFIPVQLKEEQKAHGGTFEDLKEAFRHLDYDHPVPLVWTAAQHKWDALGGVLYSRELLKVRHKAAELKDLYSCFALNFSAIMKGTEGVTIAAWIGEEEHKIEREIYQGQERLAFSSGQATLTISEDDPLVFCHMDEQGGWNAVGLQSVWNSPTLPGELHILSVLPDRNISAILLGIRHGHPDYPEMQYSGAVFWTRIGRGKDRQAFEQWRKKFISDWDTFKVTGISPGWDRSLPDSSRIKKHQIQFEVRSIDGHPLKIHTESLDMKLFKTQLTPAPSTAILEVETEGRAIDLGRKILEQTPMVRVYERRLYRTPLVKVPGYWQAAQGRVQKPMVTAEKETGGFYVQMPRSGVSGQGVGSVAWRMHVPRKGVYYIWARIRSKTGKGIFRVCLYRDKSSPLYLRRWLISGIDGWSWAPLDLNELHPGRQHTPLRLPKGEVILQIFPEFHSYGMNVDFGIGIDRLFITADPRKRPLEQEEGFNIRMGWIDRPVSG